MRDLPRHLDPRGQFLRADELGKILEHKHGTKISPLCAQPGLHGPDRSLASVFDNIYLNYDESTITKKIKSNVETIERNMVAGFILMLSFAFILLSVVFLFKYFFGLDYGFTLLIIGLLLLVSGLFYQNGGSKK